MTVEMHPAAHPVICAGGCGKVLGWTIADAPQTCADCRPVFIPSAEEVIEVGDFKRVTYFRWGAPPCGCRDRMATEGRRDREERGPLDVFVCGCGANWTRQELQALAAERRAAVAVREARQDAAKAA